jgi:hypothetical protein
MIEMGEKAELVTAARDARRVANFILNFMGENDTIVLSKMQDARRKIQNPSQVEVERQKEDGHLKMLRQTIDTKVLPALNALVVTIHQLRGVRPPPHPTPPSLPATSAHCLYRRPPLLAAPSCLALVMYLLFFTYLVLMDNFSK